MLSYVYLNTAANNSLITGMSGFASDAVGQFGTVLPLAFGILVTVALIFAGISWFRALVHL